MLLPKMLPLLRYKISGSLNEQSPKPIKTKSPRNEKTICSYPFETVTKYNEFKRLSFSYLLINQIRNEKKKS
ncbi:hypothetical protein E1A91_D10G258300v1 [Gossypium mustelinum]|uniref:Uncharacterized protein n=1 Tax=Gossypium mustelinum TaxID=34275 RepID=A0A5D2TEG0_GOSMU|nr:hypothetical protein E1A91_D10G258300v1 [Gossypium mustelinum]